MSFPRYEKLYRPIGSESKPGQPSLDRPGTHRYDLFTSLRQTEVADIRVIFRASVAYY